MSIDEVVGLAPVHVGEELLERLVEHRTAPDDRLVLAGEEPHRDHAHAVRLGRDDARRRSDPGGRATPSMRGSEKPQTSASTTATRATALRERDREVGRDRRLADAALARRDREHARPGVGERVDARAGPAAPRPGRRRPRAGSAAGSPLRTRRDRRGARRRPSRGRRRRRGRRLEPSTASRARCVEGQLRCPRPAGQRQRERHDHGRAVDGDPLHQPELDDRAPELGLLDRGRALLADRAPRSLAWRPISPLPPPRGTESRRGRFPLPRIGRIPA